MCVSHFLDSNYGNWKGQSAMMIEVYVLTEPDVHTSNRSSFAPVVTYETNLSKRNASRFEILQFLRGQPRFLNRYKQFNHLLSRTSERHSKRNIYQCPLREAK